MKFIKFIFSHHYNIVLYENGKWCFKRYGWKKRTYDELVDQGISDFVICVALIALLWFA